MQEQKKKIQAALILTAIVVVVVGVLTIVKKFLPSNEVITLTEYFPEMQEDEILLILGDTLIEEKGLYVDNTVYVSHELVKETFNKRFYWDSNENLLIYTTPTEIIKAEVGSNSYYVNKSKDSVNYPIIKMVNNEVYVALEYVKKYSNIEYEVYSEPNRVLITHEWNKTYQYYDVEDATQLRKEPSIKSGILKEMEKGAQLIQIALAEDEEESKSFTKVISGDGVVGYVKTKALSEVKEAKRENDYQEPVYSHISKDYEINLVFHQVTNEDANDGLLNLLGATKNVTTVSPTWFKVASDTGEISSLASEAYVERAHKSNVEVWALVDDFDDNVNKHTLLSKTSNREKLENELIAEAIKYNLDGINIDFEKISQDTGEHFIQFIREMSVKCRSNGIVLSIDNYVSESYNSYYDREEQGMVADYVITMAYDEHTNGSEESGSVSSLPYVKKAVENILKEVPAERNIIAIPFYTRLWEETTGADGSVSITSEAYSMGNGAKVLEENDADTIWLEEEAQFYGEYESNGTRYRMWLEDDASIEEKLKVIDKANVAGIAAWKLGLEKQSVWNVIEKYVN